MKGKKGFEIGMSILVVLTIIVMISAAVALNNKIGGKHKIGDLHYKLISTYDNSERIFYYIDVSSKLAALNSIKSLSESGGMINDDCGEYLGAKLLQNAT